jgi:Na+/H+ antiporter NhaD/arsenite permease-like protein
MIYNIFFFVGLLLSLSFIPLLFPKLWHRYENYILSFWGVGCCVALIKMFGWSVFSHWFLEMISHDYIPFTVLLVAIFTINSGFHIDLKTTPSPLKNGIILAVASIFSSIIGPTGSSMIFLRPLIRINKDRKHQTHTIVFFIFTVANVGGALTPLGDPPIFIGFLNSVDFFWPIKYLFHPFCLVMACLLLIYFFIDTFFWKKETLIPGDSSITCSIQGKRNIIFLLAVIVLVPLSSYLSLGSVIIAHIKLEMSHLVRDGFLLLFAICSYLITPKDIRHKNHFSWAPLSEVARVFLAIFTTMIPVTLLLQKGGNGPMSGLFKLMDHGPKAYFWLSGTLSAFLDNAPTYLLFFRLAGDNAKELMQNVSILQAISLGTVLFGAMTYIGNAPNLMIRSIAKQSQIAMPSFVGYIGWSCLFLLPVLFLLSLLFF